MELKKMVCDACGAPLSVKEIQHARGVRFVECRACGVENVLEAEHMIDEVTPMHWVDTNEYVTSMSISASSSTNSYYDTIMLKGV